MRKSIIIKTFLCVLVSVLSLPQVGHGKITLVYSLSEDGPTRRESSRYNNAKFRDAMIESNGFKWCIESVSKPKPRALFNVILGQDGTVGFGWYNASDFKIDYFNGIKKALDLMSERNDTLYVLPPWDSHISWFYSDSVFKVDTIAREEMLRFHANYMDDYVHTSPEGQNMILFGNKSIIPDMKYSAMGNLSVFVSIEDKGVYEEYRKKCAEKGLMEIDNERVTKNGDCEDLMLYWEYVRKSDREILRQHIDHNHLVSPFYYDAQANAGDSVFIPKDSGTP